MSSSPTDQHAPPGAPAASVDVTMPQMGVSVAEGTIVAWHKRVGDWVAADETVCEISTDKIDTEVPAPVAGRLEEIVVDVDQTVPVGTVLARIAIEAVAGEAPAAEQGPPASPAPSATPTGTPAAAAPAPVSAPASGPDGPGPSGPSSDGERRYSPVVQRIAAREGIDLDQVRGTGRGGRVRKQDVLAVLETRGEAVVTHEQESPPLHSESPYREEGAPSGPTKPSEPGELARPATGTTGAARAAPAGPRDPSPVAPALAGGDVAAPLSRMRRSIAEHMVRSLHTAAHCTSITEADMSRVEAARRRLGLSPLPFVARCVIDALRAHPALNATLEGDTLTRHHDVNLGIAVSLGEEGLIVPVIHRAQELSHEGLAARVTDLARRARSGGLTPDEVRAGTFTITNPGGFGTIASTPIINQPQVAILDLEAVVRRPVVVGDGAGGEAIAIRPMTNLCLSWDHRALDGAMAARFLATVRKRIESWEA